MRRTVAVALSTLLLAATPLVAAATVLGWYDVNGNGRVDTWLVDDNGDGVTDRMIVDGNENNWGEAQVFYAGNLPFWSTLDGNEDGWNEMAVQSEYWADGTLRSQTMWSDQNGDGLWESGYYDGNLDGIYEQVCVDTNFDGLADTWKGTAAPLGRGAVDNMVASNLAIKNWIENLQSRGYSVLLPPSFPIP